MQSSGAPYQGSAPCTQYSDHTYDNPMGVHCPPGGYQGYVNGPYPVSSQRPPLTPHHHYGGHQMQQGVPYRGAYPASQNQYRPPPPNQDMYRNHHSAYVGANHNSNRNMPVKQVWGDNNSSEMMPVYNHVPPRPPMMPNSPAMNVSSMRSPPHLPGNINPVPSPGTQHYRQMQSPGHSPQSWPQAQVPSPVMHHASRATPSPLPSHARSPGHSQPFSPPSATHMASMSNLTPHAVNPVLPENCQPSPMVSQQVPSKGATDPLHSLQKMVMLDQNADQIQMNCHMTNENCDALSIHHGNQMVTQQNMSDDSKDSPYTTYFNLDENRLESEPQSSAPKPSDFIQGNATDYTTNSPRMMNNDMPTDMSQSMKSPHLHMLNPPDNSYRGLEPVHIVAPQTSAANLLQTAQNQINGPPSHIPNSVPKTTEPSLGNSAPVIVNSQHSPGCLHAPSNSAAIPAKLESSNTVTASIPVLDIRSEQKPEEVVGSPHEVEEVDDAQPRSEPAMEKPDQSSKLSSSPKCEPDEVKEDCEVNEVSSLEKEAEVVMPCSEKKIVTPPSIIKLQAIKPAETSELQSNDIKPIIDEVILKAEQSLITLNSTEVKSKTVVKEEQLTEESESEQGADTTQVSLKCNEKEISESSTLSSSHQVSTVTNLKSVVKSKIISDPSHSPVKVVIHRIRTNPTTDAWHVPKEKDKVSIEKQKAADPVNSVSPRILKTGPQIIILSSASCKKNPSPSTDNPNSPSPKKPAVVANNRTAVNKSLASKLGAASSQRHKVTSRASRLSRRSSSSESFPISPQKRSSVRGRGRGRGKVVVARKLKGKGSLKKKGKMKKNMRNRQVDLEVPEVIPKLKKVKAFLGPYVHVTGSKQKPSSITVVNMALKDDEKGKLLRSKPEVLPKRPRVGHTSTLSPHYDAFNKDRTWLCVFCNKGSHCSGLGDLYGPYYTKNEDVIASKETSSNLCKATPTTTHSIPRSVRSKRRKSDPSASENEKPLTSKKAKVSNKVEPPVPGKESAAISQGEQKSEPENALKEVWIHEDCAVWCQSISLMGSQIHGLDDAIQESKENICSTCKLIGATLGCWGKGCKEQYHFSCAKEKGCQMDIENFSLFCPKHKVKRSVSSPKTSRKSSECLH